MRKTQGFTLIEMMITVAIVAIIAAIGAPSLKNFMEANKVRAETQRISGLLSLARNHAVSTNQPVVVSGGGAPGELDLTVFVDDGNDDYVYASADNDLLVRQSSSGSTNLDYGSNTEVSTNSAVLFNAQGRLTNPTNANATATAAAVITICDAEQSVGRRVSVSPIGRVSVSELASPSTGCL